MGSNNKIYIIDVTNRDGVQTSRLGLAKLEKTMLNLYLNEMGIYQSEFGFPVTRHEVNYLNANLRLAEMGVIKPMLLQGWLRAIKEDVDKAFDRTKVRHVNLSMSTSEQMLFGKFQGRKSRQDVIDMMVEAVHTAKQRGALTIGVNAEDASRTDLDYLVEFALAAKELVVFGTATPSATIIPSPSTNGYITWHQKLRCQLRCIVTMILAWPLPVPSPEQRVL